MADPVKRPLTWNRKYYTYAEKHGIYDVFHELIKEIAIWKPEDPVLYIRDELTRIARGVYTPKLYMLGPEPLTSHIAEGIAVHCGAKLLSLEDVINDTVEGIREHLAVFLEGADTEDEALRRLLVATIARRLSMDDCTGGYVLYGFPQSRAQAMMAQTCGLIPRQIFILLPEGPVTKESLAEAAASASNVSTVEDAFTVGKPAAQISLSDLQKYREFFIMKEIASSYPPDHMKIRSFERWNAMEPDDLLTELLGAIVTRKSCGAPFIPRILLIGPPGSGKSKLADYLSSKYRLANVGWLELIRGAVNMADDVGDACKQYLETLTPLSDEAVSTLLQRRLSRDDCMKKGFVLHGFPESKRHCVLLDELAFSGNRVFLLSCTDTICKDRMAKKRKTILKKKVPNQAVFYQHPRYELGDGDRTKPSLFDNPYAASVVDNRLEMYNANLEGIINHFGSTSIYVDATETYTLVQDFVDAATLRPPNIRFD